MNRRGGLFDIFLVLIVLFIVIVFFAGWMYGFGLMTDKLVALDVPLGDNYNVSQAAQDTFGQINSALPVLRWLGLVIVISMIIGIMVSNFLVRAHPVFFLVYVLFTVVAVVFSAYLSNAYVGMLTAANPLTPTLQSFTELDYMLINLPIWTTLIGILGAIFLFIGVIVSRDQGGGVPI